MHPEHLRRQTLIIRNCRELSGSGPSDSPTWLRATSPILSSRQAVLILRPRAHPIPRSLSFWFRKSSCRDAVDGVVKFFYGLWQFWQEGLHALAVIAAGEIAKPLAISATVFWHASCGTFVTAVRWFG